MRFFLFCLFALIALLPFGSASTKSKNNLNENQLSAGERELLQATNKIRGKYNVDSVEPNPILMDLARSYVKRIAEKNDLNHNIDGSISKRLKRVGYLYQRSGENLAAGPLSPTDIVYAWLGSEHHKKNLLDSRFTEIGIGIYRAPNGVIFYCQILAQPQ
jgi:uncharacterized protein YkwD